VRRRRLSSIEPKLVWMLGSPRSGSTWLRHLLSDGVQVVGMSEPLIGMHLGAIASAAVPMWPPAGAMRMPDIRRDADYFFSDEHEAAWRPALRQLLLTRLAPHLPRGARRLVVQEPNGSEGADLIMRALPRSRLLFLLRDGRDVVDSMLDALGRGTWVDTAFGVGRDFDERARREVIEHEAGRWALRTRVTMAAYESHDPALRLQVRYEEVLADTGTQVARVLDWLGSTAPYADRVAANEFAAIPAEQRGAGRFHRSASPGGWRESLSADEQDICRRVMGEVLAQVGYPWERPAAP
jgi:LPS sulfotransferase NodH